jgi:K+-sensing histidine kinase KdpD
VSKDINDDPWYLRHRSLLTSGFICLYWSIESLMDKFFLVRGSWKESFLPSNANELWARAILITAILLGSWYSHVVSKTAKGMNKEIRDSFGKLKRLVYFLLHDLQNLSTGLGLAAGRLEKKHSEALGLEGVKLCNVITENVSLMRNLMRQLTELIEVKELPLKIRKVNIIEEVMKTIRDEFSIRLGEREVNLIVSDDIPIIKVDLVFITRLLRNLIDNALAHGGKNLSRIEVDYSEEGNFHVLMVGDNGRGIREPERIFEMFERGETSNGIGLGLANALEIAERHGGYIRIKSLSRKGATFAVYLAKSL